MCYYRSFCGKSGGTKGGRSLYSLSFVYTFRSDGDRVYFAYNFPYTFTRLQRFVRKIEEDPVRQKVFRRRLLCRTLSGNACDVLTVTAPIKNNEELARRRIVVVSARVHPGETVASWMMHGLIEFITGNSETALKLRKSVIFKLVPMLNPDGVINGNYRCSLAGIDLNRRWDRPSRVWHPTIWHTKQMIKQLNAGSAQRVVAYIDLHGHSRKKNVFVYGCDPTRVQRKSLLPRSISTILDGRSESKNKKPRGEKHAAKTSVLNSSDGTPSAASCAQPTNVTEAAVSERIATKKFEREIDQIVALRTHAQLLTYVMSQTASLSTSSDISISFKDSNFSVKKSKKATARVVVWNECEVMNSITIEASFCGGGDNRTDKKTKKDIVRAWKSTDSSILDSVTCACPSSTSHEDANLRHYAMEDLQAIGEIICRAIHAYTQEDVSFHRAPQSASLPTCVEGSHAVKLAKMVRAVELRRRVLAAEKKERQGRSSGRNSPGQNGGLRSNDPLGAVASAADRIYADLDDLVFDDDEEDADGSDSNPSADEMDEEDLKASATFNHIVSLVQKVHRKVKPRKTKSKTIFSGRKSKAGNSLKKKKLSKKNSPPPSRSRQRKKADKSAGTNALNKDDAPKEPIFYDLNMAHMMRRSDKHRGRQQQQQQKHAQMIQLQLQASESATSTRKGSRGGRGSFDRKISGGGSSFQGFNSKSFSASRVGPKRGGLNLFTKGKEIDELRSRERHYWLMRRQGKGIQQASGSFSHSSLPPRRNDRQQHQQQHNPNGVHGSSDEPFMKAYRAASRDPTVPSIDFEKERNSLMSAPASSDSYNSANVRTGSLGARMLAEGLDNSSTYTYFNSHANDVRKTGCKAQKISARACSAIDSGDMLLFTDPLNQTNHHADAVQPPPIFALPAHQRTALPNAVTETNDWAASKGEAGFREQNDHSLATGPWITAVSTTAVVSDVASATGPRDSSSFTQYSDAPGGLQSYANVSHPSRNQGRKLPPPVSMGFPGSSNANSGNSHQNMPTSIQFNLHRAHQRVLRTRGASGSDSVGGSVFQVDQKFPDRHRKSTRSHSVDDGRGIGQDSTADTTDGYSHTYSSQKGSVRAIEPVSGVATNIGRIVSGSGGGGTASIFMQGNKMNAKRQMALSAKTNIGIGRSPLQRQTLVATSIHKWPSIGAGSRHGGNKRRLRRGQIRKSGVRR